MGFAPVAHVGVQGNSGFDTTGDEIDTSGANLIIIQGTAADSPPTISDKINGVTTTNTWVPVYDWAADVTDGFARALLYYCLNPTSVGAHHTFQGTGGRIGVVVSAWSGADTSAAADDGHSSGGANTGNSVTYGASITPTQDGDLVVWSVEDLYPSNTTDTISCPDGTRLISTLPSGTFLATVVNYEIQTTAVAINPTWTFPTTSHASGSIIAFKAAAGGGTTPVVIDFAAPIEFLASPVRDAAAVVEELGGVLREAAARLEALPAVRRDAAPQFEAFASLFRDAAVPAEELSSAIIVTGDAGVRLESIANTRFDQVVAQEGAGGVQCDAVVGDEALRSVTRAAGVALEVTANVRGDAAGQAESSALFFCDLIGGDEILRGVRRDAAAADEALAGVRGDGAPYTENLGQLLVVGDAAGALEVLANVRGERSAGIATIAQALIDAGGRVEFNVGVRRDAADPAEALGTVTVAIVDGALELEFLASNRSDAPARLMSLLPYLPPWARLIVGRAGVRTSGRSGIRVRGQA